MERLRRAQCPSGFFQNETAATTCKRTPNGTIILGGGTAYVEVPKGSYIGCKGTCFYSCGAGAFGDDPPTGLCHKCPAGWSSFKGAIECTQCGKGKFAAFNGSACESCPSEFFQSQEGSTQCLECPLGYTQPNTGESACTSLNWVYPKDCTSEQFLNDTGNRTTWKCEACLEGASCVGPVKLSDLPNMFGWWKVSARLFAQCLYPPACPGGPNPSLAGKYLAWWH